MPTVIFLLQDVPQLYGAERVTLDLVQALGERLQAQLWVIGEQRLGPAPGALSQEAERRGIITHRFPVRGRFSLRLVRELRSRLKHIQDPILHTVGYKAHLHALVAARGLCPAVTTIHGWLVRPEWKERFYEWLEIRALRHDRAVICLSRYYEERLLGCGVKRERLHVIPTGLDSASLPGREEIRKQPPDPFTLLLMGRLSWEKNHMLLLRAVQRLHREGQSIRVILAGEGPERAAIERFIAESDLSDIVRFVGHQPVADLMPLAHALVLCSRIENLPLSILEAMAWGRPVVATAVGGVPDLVVDGETGFLTPPDNEEALAMALAQLSEDGSLVRRLGQAGRERIEREFSLSRCVECHEEIYRGLQVEGGR